ncbi:hypothetical protein [Nocardia sp. NPDC050717]|uniref:hypothetical protein n=1 Tax=Nocardia sp. NPDC050717 TaxID=3157221 RepID=UPI0033F1EDF8
MNHAEHDESIGSMLASIAAALREVSDKLDIVAARVQHEVPTFPADDDLPEKTRIHRLESWAFHASQDISRLSSRLDALDGGDTPPRTGRSTPSRREVREAAERAAAEAEHADEGARPPLERRSPRTDHLGDPTWPLTVAPIPRASGEASGAEAVSWSPFSAPDSESRSDQSGGSGGVSTTLAHDMGAARDAASAERRNGRTVAAAHGAREETRNGAVPEGGVALDSGRGLNGAGTGLSQRVPSAGGRVAEEEPSRNGAVVRNGAAADAPSPGTTSGTGSGREVVFGTAGTTAVGGVTPREPRSATEVFGDSVRGREPAESSDTAAARDIRTATDGRDGGAHRPISPVETAVPGTVGDAVPAAATETSGVAGASADGRVGGHRTAEIPVERARPVGRVDAEVETAVSRIGSAASGDGPGAAETAASAAGSAPAQRTNGHAHGSEPRTAEPGSGGTANGIHWTFADDDTLTSTPVVRNGHDHNGFTGGDSRDQLPSASSSGTPAPPARLSAPKTRPVPSAEAAAPPAHSAPVPTSITIPAGDSPERVPEFADPTGQADTRATDRRPAADSLVNGQNGATNSALSGFSATVELTPSTTGSPAAETDHTANPGPASHAPEPAPTTSATPVSTSPHGMARSTELTAPSSVDRGQAASSTDDTGQAAEHTAMTASSDIAAHTGGMRTQRGSAGETSPTGIPLSTGHTAPARIPPGEVRSATDQAAGTADVGRAPGGLTTAADSAGQRSVAQGYPAPAETRSAYPAAADEYTGYTPSGNGRGPADMLTNDTGRPGSADFGAPVPGGGGAQTSPFDRVPTDPEPPTATDAAGITVTGTYRAFDIERAHVDKLQAMLDELKRSAGLPPGRRDVFGPPTTDAG